jgi:hypothetical protein
MQPKVTVRCASPFEPQNNIGQRVNSSLVVGGSFPPAGRSIAPRSRLAVAVLHISPIVAGSRNSDSRRGFVLDAQPPAQPALRHRSGPERT